MFQEPSVSTINQILKFQIQYKLHIHSCGTTKLYMPLQTVQSSLNFVHAQTKVGNNFILLPKIFKLMEMSISHHTFSNYFTRN